MTKIDIFSGFLGAGKTTLIKKLLKEAYAGERVVLIENEFGEIGIDGGFLSDAGIEITEMNSGCICCSLVGDFSKALLKVQEEYKPERIIIEPSGVGKLSDVIRAVKAVNCPDFVLNSYTTVADATKTKMYIKNFGEFFLDQIENASAIVLSHSDKATDAKITEAISLIKEHNSEAILISTPIESLSGKELLAAIEKKNASLEEELSELERDAHHHHHHAHHHHEHGEECECGCHEHHHPEHDEECECGCHEHHHEHGEECDCGHHEHHHHEHGEECGCGHHDHHHHHHADEVFTSFGVETAKKFTEEKIREILESFDEGGEFGIVLRAKGIVASNEGEWIHFDYVPGEADVRRGKPGIIGRLCVIGSALDKEKIAAAFEV
ncbi:MAG: GTP-binding protein [Clostridia bacterium]|nr:GTP-binding protein [Clostridia bacterium]